MPEYRQPIYRLAAAAVIILAVVSLACNLSSNNENAIGTSSAQTITAEFAKQTETAAAAPSSTSTLFPTQPSASTASPTQPSAPPPPSESPIPVLGAPTIISTVDTNCREGPDAIYRQMGYLLVGQQSTVVGRNDSSTWWFIENPQKPGEQCWVQSPTTVVTGETASLPVITPPPPPFGDNPDFVAFFAGINACGGSAVIFEIQNVGNAPFRSMALTIEDRTLGDIVHSSTRNSPFFPNPGGCPGGGQNLEPGGVKFIGGVVDNFVNSGDQLEAEITLCTDAGLGGECVDTSVVFIFP